jgi:Glycosyl hydrolases family 16
MRNWPIKLICFLSFIATSCGPGEKVSSSASMSSSLQAIKKESLESSEVEVEHITSSKPTNTISPTGWKLTFEDHFDSKEIAISKGADPACFNRNPVCMINWWGAQECPEFKTELTHLNKCHWSAYHYYNYMDFDLPEGQGINSFHPKMIKIQDGYLYLNAEKSFYSVNRCKTKFNDPRLGNIENYTIECPFISGAIESRPHDGLKPGVVQEFGRFEVRAKLNHGPGAWPAHWLLPVSLDEDGCGWPYNGEIDIMESWAKHPDEVSGTLHTGDCSKKVKLSKGFPWKAKSSFYPDLTISQRNETFYKDFHTYAVEWDKDKVRFLVDDIFIGQITQGDIIKNKNTPRGGLPVKIPKGLFYWILNTTIYKEESNPPDQNNFTKQEHVIDYVKSYRKCTAGDAPENCYQPTYKNTDALCPGIRDYLGDHNGKSMCEAWPNLSISVANCFGKDGVIDSENKWCLLNEGQWYKARTLGNACSWPREHVGWNSGKPVCKAWPHFRINPSNCDGTVWDGYCLWPEDGWWRARLINN